MSVAKVIEISSASNKSFEDTIRKGITKAGESVRGVRGAWVAEQKVTVDGGEIAEYRADLKVSFVLE